MRIFTRGSVDPERSESQPLAWGKTDSYNPATLPRRFFSGNKWVDASLLPWGATRSFADVKAAGTEIPGYKSLHFS
jgi:hypothetical protein